MQYTREEGCLAWLANAAPNPTVLVSLLEQYGSAEAIYDVFEDTDALAFSEHFEPKMIAALRSGARRENMRNLLVKMRDAQIHIMSVRDDIYPEALRNISDPPPFLFYRGDPTCLGGKCIAMVGSRNASPDAVEVTKNIAYDLARQGITIVSGLALGIDAAAHRGCLDAGGRTAAFCGCGIDVNYPTEHEVLKQEIIDRGGVLLSEYPPGRQVRPWHFPVRNRLISGTSSAVIMMECRVRSGSMTTVEHALNQGREVFAYPGLEGAEQAAGARELLRDGAGSVRSAEDILRALGWCRPPARRRYVTFRRAGPAMPEPKPQTQELPVTDNQKLIIRQLEHGMQSYDQLAASTGLDAPSLSGELTILQLLGLIRPLPGKQFMLEPKKER